MPLGLMAPNHVSLTFKVITGSWAVTSLEILDDSLKIFLLISQNGLIGAFLPGEPVRVEGDLFLPDSHIDYRSSSLDNLTGTLDAAFLISRG